MKNKFPYRYRVLIFLFFLIFITYLDRASIAFFETQIMSEFHLNHSQWGMILGAFLLSYALFEIPSGAWGDRIGQRSAFTRIVIWWSLFTAFTGLTVGFFSLILVRFLFGMGEAGAFPNTAAAISKWFPAEETSRGISIVWSGLFAGSAAAPFLVMAIANAYGWRTPFFVNGFIGILWVLVCISWFKNNPSEMKGMPNAERTFIEANRRYSKHSQKYPWKKVLRNRSLLALVLAHSAASSASYFFLLWLPPYLNHERHFSKNEILWTYTIAWSLATIGCFFSGHLSDWLIKRKGIKFGRRSVGFTLLAMCGLSVLMQTFISNHVTIIAVLIIGVFFLSPMGIPSYGTCVDIGGHRAGTVSGIMNFCAQMASFFFVTLFGKLADTSHGFSLPVYILATVLLVCSFLWFVVDPSKPLVEDEEVRSVSVVPVLNPSVPVK
jgi:sugar phosphate permease